MSVSEVLELVVAKITHIVKGILQLCETVHGDVCV